MNCLTSAGSRNSLFPEFLTESFLFLYVVHVLLPESCVSRIVRRVLMCFHHSIVFVSDSVTCFVYIRVDHIKRIGVCHTTLCQLIEVHSQRTQSTDNHKIPYSTYKVPMVDNLRIDS